MKELVEIHAKARNEGKVAEFYNSIDSDTYEKFVKYIDFSDPWKICEAISKPEPSASEQVVNPGELYTKGFGYINLRKDAAIFDIGHGTGIMGKLLTQEGYTNIDGADGNPGFVETVKKTGHYQNT